MLVDVDYKGFDNYEKMSHVLTTYFRSYYCMVQDIKDESPVMEKIRQIKDLNMDNNLHLIYYYN